MKTQVKKSTSKRQLNKAKRAQAKIKAKASERRKKRLARSNVNIPRKYKFKHLTKRVNNNGGLIKWHKMLEPRNKVQYGGLYLVSNSLMNRGEFKIKTMIKIGTRLKRRMETVKQTLRKKQNTIFYERKKSYYRKIRAYVSYSERALGLRLGKGKGNLGGWRIPIKPNQILFNVENLSIHGGQNLIKHTIRRLGGSLFISGVNVYR